VRVLVADRFEQAGLDSLEGLGCEVLVRTGLDAAGLEGAVRESRPEVLIVRSTKVPGSVIEAGRGTLRAIIRAGAGVDNIDVAAASSAGVPVANCPGTNAVAVAELTMGLLVCCDRRLPDQVAAIREGRWDKPGFGKARGLKASTLGVVGLGAIGLAVARRALAFEMNVVAWSRGLTRARAAEAGAEFGGTTRGELLEMLPKCDAVSIHVAATQGTKRMCDAAFFGAMRERAYFINTSRGTVVDEGALRDAVTRKGIRAALDVFENQPAPADTTFDSPTVRLPGVYGTHHCGASTDQAQRAVAEETVRLVGVLTRTGALENRVN
jgi:D-3-phosphoglycerate dehydrogenase